MSTRNRIFLVALALLSFWLVDSATGVPKTNADSGWLIVNEGGQDWLMIDAGTTVGWNVEFGSTTAALIYPAFTLSGGTNSSYVKVAGNAHDPSADIRYYYTVKWADTGQAIASFGIWDLDNGGSWSPSLNICHLSGSCVTSMATRGLLVEAFLYGQGSADTYGGIGSLAVTCIGCTTGSKDYGLGVWDAAPNFVGRSDHFSPVNYRLHPVADTPDPVNTISGNFQHSNTDLAIPGKGLALESTRSYSSGWTDSRSLGYG